MSKSPVLCNIISLRKKHSNFSFTGQCLLMSDNQKTLAAEPKTGPHTNLLQLHRRGGGGNCYLCCSPLLPTSFQSSGHHVAKLDPLGIGSADLDTTVPDILTLEYYNFSKFLELNQSLYYLYI